ncbi:tetratricopeptide repeat protein 12 isoform X1 [Corythoichthys intestinalis]|uniref:tetratricopeptide repeat protein 12 isoform X1 n=1 Tax=Corythoichthys intestinalis TaxID=161448 RepID=UPI0025A4E192|nr:tetratricopeptide repeat protein 12 isoform X1 [Corythoichthys intestinalis]XP_061796975.1 tetratricopeptide repeat protein 12-like [Nerophis lumbriciformis]
MDSIEDLDVFLKNIDDISNLVKDLSSSDVEVQQKALRKADCKIAALHGTCKTKVNKTTINTNPTPNAPANAQTESAENFLRFMEQDAEDRRKRRLAQEQKATVFKDRGNQAYAQGDYETAVKYYSDGLAELRDMQQLYTNRAQAYIKLERYEEAISDCKWALKCNENCIKAYLHMGKAYHGLKEYSESRTCFEKITELDPHMEKMVREYLTKIDLDEKKEHQELNARQDFDRGVEKAKLIPQLLEKLSEPGQMLLYYCGLLEILSQIVTDCSGQTLFRLHDGFKIIDSNDTMRSCLLQEANDPCSQDLCVLILTIWMIMCRENDENQKTLLTFPVSKESIVPLVTSEHDAVQKECLELLCLYSLTSHGRCLLINNLDVCMLMKNLMACISKPKKQREIRALLILQKLAEEKKFCRLLRNKIADSVAEPFTAIMTNISKDIQNVIPPLLSVVGSLIGDDVIRHTLVHHAECWKAFLLAIKQCIACSDKDILYPLLGLLINLSTLTSPVIKENAINLCGCCLDLLRDDDVSVVTRAMGVLSNVLPQSSEAVNHVVQRDVVKTVQQLLKQADLAGTKYAIKILTLCTAASQIAREELVKSDKKLSVLRRLLGFSCDEMVSGNAALCLAHCLELKGIASNLLGTDIVILLLRHAAGDAKKTAVQQNSAIALGKLCQSEPRHVSRLRELHGFEILHSCMKLIN